MSDRFTGTNNLGENQQGILRSLVEHHAWSPGCGWIWSTQSETVRLLDGLVKRGLATKTTSTRQVGPASYQHNVEVPTYRPTEVAEAWFIENYPVSAERLGMKAV